MTFIIIELNMTENTHKVIIATYNMYDITDGKNILIESTSDSQPLNIITGMGMTPLPALEEKLSTLATGADYEFALTADKAFGEYDEEAIIDVGKESFIVNGKFDDTAVTAGSIIPLQNESGERFGAKVLEVSEDTVRLDLNHPYSGRALLFSGKIIESHDATDEEIMAMTSQCGCGCGGNCDGNSCGCDDSDGCCGGGCAHCAS